MKPGRACLAGCLCLLVAVCDVDLGPRATTPGRTFGEIVFREACQRVTYSAELAARQRDPARPLDASGARYRPLCDGSGAAPSGAPPVAAALDAERAGIISDVDRVVPEALLTPLDQHLRAIVPLEDDGTLGLLVRRGGTLLRAAAADRAAMDALGRLGWRDGFRAPQWLAVAPRSLLADPELDTSLGALLPLLAPAAAGAPGSEGARAAAGLRALLRALSTELREAVPVADIGAEERTLRVALRFLLSSHPELRALPQPVLAVLRDHRGAPLVDATGGLPAPLVDRNGDGLADVDGAGRFIGAAGAAVAQVGPFPYLDPRKKDLAAARDPQGRALRRPGEAPLYRYADLTTTALGALMRDGRDLIDPAHDVPLGLLRGAAHLLGPRRDAERRYPSGRTLSYRGFSDGEGALLDLLHGYLQLLTYSDSGAGNGADLLRLIGSLQALLRDNEAVISRNIDAVLKVYDEAKKPQYEAARLPESATLYDDLAPVLVRMLRIPGLLSDIVDALRDPATGDLGQLAALLASDSSYVYMNQDQLDWRQGGATVGPLGKPVRRDRPDSDVDKNAGNPANNRSIMQRILHLVHDANGLRLCNKRDSKVRILLFDVTYAEPCSLFKIDDLALFYVLSFVGRDIQARPGDFHPTAVVGADFYSALSDSFQRDLIRFFGALGESIVEGLLGIPGFGRYPHPAVAARLLFQDFERKSDFLKGSIDNGSCSPRRDGTLCCNQGHGWKEHHDGVLFALERAHPRDAGGRERTDVTFFTAFKPIVRAFARHAECVRYDDGGRCLGERSAAKILVDLFSVLHRHWPTPESRFYGQGYEAQNQKSGAVRYEPLLAKVLGETDLWPATTALAPVLLALRTPGGQPALPTLAGFLRWFLDPAAPRLGGALRYRDGRQTAVRGDRRAAYGPSGDPVIRDVLAAADSGKVTPYYLLADAYRKKRERLAQDPEAERRWKTAISRLADLLFLGKPGPGHGFQNPRSRPLQLLLLDLLRERVEAHVRSGDLGQWAREGLLQDLQAGLTGPVFAGAADLGAQLGADEGARRAAQRILWRLLDPAAGAAAVLALTGDLLQLLLDDADVVPILRALGPLLDPDEGPVEPALALLRRGRERDPHRVLLALGSNLYQADPSGLYPLYRLVDAVLEIDRARAGEPGVRGSDLDAADFAAVLRAVGDFLADQGRGLSRFMDILRARRSPSPGASPDRG